MGKTGVKEKLNCPLPLPPEDVTAVIEPRPSPLPKRGMQSDSAAMMRVTFFSIHAFAFDCIGKTVGVVDMLTRQFVNFREVGDDWFQSGPDIGLVIRTDRLDHGN